MIIYTIMPFWADLGLPKSPKFDKNELKTGFLREKLSMDEAYCAKWCLTSLVGGPRHFASEIGLDVTYFDPFRGFKRSQFGS